MKRHLILFLTLVGITASIGSCTQVDGERFHPIGLIIDSLAVGKNHDSDRAPFPLYASVPQEGLKFTVTGTGEYDRFTGIGSIELDGVEIYSSSDIRDHCYGDWGEVTKDPEKYVLYFTISPNPSDKPRAINFTIGYGYWLRQLRITQSPLLPEPESEPEPEQ